ncbi:hypothetical protein CgunFtcFv8_019440 [Champsocephalus gunnari]|uniref:CMP/dCMP-type deaminase domain-containing protein n=1 Tax=Champsocephalus gunnari TaxID=52237 RepID=A0AAN8HS60_CHAGU|nr:hypothetical protein CgunFtcFv8_019440 [Champsocephalus gunnari]
MITKLDSMLLLEKMKRRVGPDSLTFDFGHLRNRNGCHVELLFLRYLGALCPGLLGCEGTGEKRLSYSITWFCSWSPCANCSIRLSQFLSQTPNLRLRIFVSRLYFCDMENSPARDGLIMLKKAGVQTSVMSYKDFFYCWHNFVDCKQKLKRILQPCETEDLRDAFKLLGL